MRQLLLLALSALLCLSTVITAQGSDAPAGSRPESMSFDPAELESSWIDELSLLDAGSSPAVVRKHEAKGKVGDRAKIVDAGLSPARPSAEISVIDLTDDLGRGDRIAWYVLAGIGTFLLIRMMRLPRRVRPDENR